MDIKIIDAGEIISRRGGGGRKSGARYGNYTKAIAPHLDWLKEQIAESDDGMIRIKLADFANECGMKMKKVVSGKAVDGTGLDPVSVGWGFKYALYHAGIVFTTGKVDDGQPVLIMRMKIEGDELPKSLQDKTEGEGVDETGEGVDETGGEGSE